MYSFSYEDVKAMATAACEHMAGRAPVLVGTAGIWDRNLDKRPSPETFTQQAVELSQFAEGAGANAVVHTMPEAILPKDGESHADVILRYFEAVCEAVTCPVFIYQPPATAPEYCVTMDLVAKLAAMPRIAGMKLSSKNALYISNICWAVRDKDYAVITGMETAFLAGLASGTKAVIGQGATLNPKILVAIQDRFEAGDLPGAREAQRSANMLVEESTNCVAFMKRYAVENGYALGVTDRSMAANPYMKDRATLTQEDYEAFKRIFEAEVAKYA